MGDLLKTLGLLAVQGIPSVGIIILFYKYEAEYVKNILFLFFITMVCHWGADFFINVYTNSHSPCSTYSPILFQLLFTNCDIADINNMPIDQILNNNGRIFDLGFFFETLLIDYIMIWTTFIIFYWGILKAILDYGWTNKQWFKYAIWSFILFQIISNNEFLFDLYYELRGASF